MRQAVFSFWAILAAVSSLWAGELKLQRTIAAHDKSVLCAAFSPNGRFLASGSLRKAKLWDVATGKNTAVLDDVRAYKMTFSPDGRVLAFSTSGGRIKLWDVAASKITATLNTHNAGSLIEFASDSKALFWTDDMILDADGKTWTVAQHTTIKLWDIVAGRNTPICVVCKENDPRRFSFVVTWAFSPDGKTLAVRDEKGTIEIWDMPARKKNVTFEAYTNYGSLSVAFSPDGKTLALARGQKSRDEAKIDIRNVATGKKIVTLHGHSIQVHSVAFSPDGKTLVSCGRDKKVKLWDVATRRNIANLDTAPEFVNFALFSPDGKTLALAGHDGTIGLWDVGR